ncbi:hypothetical protein Q6346_13755 [Isoptericola sp. b490]|uniref:hypothetical protein n=1 Tax=Actinotalea lenta TaxID=3064654 RepID=UPI002712908A|nr:hypothetical protein [Isoptericola sp. b490]MDO8122375.1 hypothetical protein [Isoptericola sp. b490]
MGNGIVVLVVVGLALMGTVTYLSWLSAKRRREALQAVAAQRGWRYAARDDAWVDAFDGEPFGTGHSRRATNVLRGEYDGRGFVAFDYVYSTTESSTDAQGRTTSREQSHPFTVIAVDTGFVLPSLHVTPETFFARTVGRLVIRDIQFESEEFNRAFTLQCPDRKFAFDVLHPRMMEFLLAHRDAAFRFDRGHVLAVREGRASVAQIDDSLALVDAVLDRIPEFVWRDARGA